MGEPSVRTLLAAVRRHLWREQGRLVVRRAGWLSAATMLIAAAAHLIALPIPVDVVLWVLGLEWMVLLASLAWRRPADADCALWIDRHLGGASAFTTLLEPTPNPQTPAHAQALRWLERWAAAKMPAVLGSLREQRPSVGVARPLLAMAVCSALALFVLSLVDTAPTSDRRSSMALNSAPRDQSTPSIEPPVAAQLAAEIASALRSTESADNPRRTGPGDAPTAGPTRADDGSGSPANPSPLTQHPADASITPRDSRSLAAVDAGNLAGAGRSAAAMSGREAGASPDTRADVGVSRPATGTIGKPRSASTPGSAGYERQADMEQAAAFDESVSTSGEARSAARVAAAATPPRAVAGTRLTPVETSYVQAWMKATGRSR